MTGHLWAALTIALYVVAVVIVAAPTRQTPYRFPASPAIRERVVRRVDVDELLAWHARQLAAAGRYDDMLTAGLLTGVGVPVDDPGNPGARLRLVDDPHGAITEPWGRVLLFKNPPDGPDVTHALPVPPDQVDPVAAAAWSYVVPVDVYADLARRT